MHPHRGLQHRRRTEGPGPSVVHLFADGGDCRGYRDITDCGVPPGSADSFGAANESHYYTEFAVKAFRVYLCLLPLACVNKATFIYLQSLGEALLSTMLSMVREVVFGVGFALLLPLFLGLDGVLWSMPVSDALTFVISAIAIIHTCRKLQ